MTAVVTSLAGTTLGRYRLVEKLGSGGMATVYRAEDPTLGRQVAVKVMHPFIAERSEAGSRFAREAKAVAGLRHANVMALHDYAPASTEQPAYLVMELLTGPSLQRFLVDHGAPLAEIAAMLGLRIAQALAAAHAHGVVHRDVKPENVMFDGHRVVLCDFGIARFAAADGVTATGAVLGSPAYMSPEQASGSEIDARSDQFSLGAMLYQLATGALPFSGTTPLVTMAKIVKGDHAPPSLRNERMPPYLERVIERLLRKAPAERFAAVEACAEALREGLTADGFVDVDAELAAYLRDPAGYNALAEGRIVDAALAQAREARGRGQTARALAAANRVLAWRPNDARALALTVGLRARPQRIALAAAGALLVAAGAIGWHELHRRTLDRRASAVGASRVAATAALPPSTAILPARSLPPAPTTEAPKRLAARPPPAAAAALAPAGAAIAPAAAPAGAAMAPAPAGALGMMAPGGTARAVTAPAGNPGVMTPAAVAPAGTPAMTPAAVAPMGTPVMTSAAVAPASTPVMTPAAVAPAGTLVMAPATVAPAGTPVMTPAAAAPAATPAMTPAAVAPMGRPGVMAPAGVAPPLAVPPMLATPATLAVAIAPWCDLTVDGLARGRSPTTLSLPPGPHRLSCVNPVSGNRLTRDLELQPGERRELREKLYATVHVQPHLVRGDAIAVDGTPASSAAAQVEPGRHRVTLYKAGAEVETRWIDVPPRGCTLVDAPQLSCEIP